jgi:2-polyprenyl-6-methoxyphenol hydroxylase-like FAD-dependent oxidoreductase
VKRSYRVLICGLGVAGATLGWLLAEFGFEVVIVERAPAPRGGGYIIDFWGAGYDVAERTGVLEALRSASYQIDELRLVGADGRPIAVVGAKAVRAAMGDRFFSLMRGDLAAVLYEQALCKAEVRFGEWVRHAEQDRSGVAVEFAHGHESMFDLVIGAEGVHSSLRAQLFPTIVARPTGLWAASFSAFGYPHRDPGAYVSYATVGRQVARYALRHDQSAFLFVFRAPRTADAPPLHPAAQKQCLHNLFSEAGWECREILARLDGCHELYFDAVAQVRTPRWSKGRIGLVGDAAACPSLLAGEGTSLAMAGAYILARELDRCDGDFPAALARYERRFRPVVERKQKAALRLRGWFAPKSALGLQLRNGLTRLAAAPPFSRLLIGDMVSNRLQLD